MTTPNQQEKCAVLREVLADVRGLLTTYEQDLVWSYYKDLDELLAEVDRHVSRLAQGDLGCLAELELLFAPTAGLNEIALSSGWADEYLAFGRRFDAARAM